MEFLPGAGDGNNAGFDNERREVPSAPTVAEKTKPGLERSIIYHKTGLTRASVREAWSVDVHGSFLCHLISSIHELHQK